MELADHPNVVGVKQAVDGVDIDTVTVLAADRSDFAVLAGEDAFLGPLLLLGATGGITASAHLATSRFVDLTDDALAGRVDTVRRRAASLLPLAIALFAEPNPSVVKAVLHREGRIPTPDVRMPLAPATRVALDDALRALPDGASS